MLIPGTLVSCDPTNIEGMPLIPNWIGRGGSNHTERESFAKLKIEAWKILFIVLFILGVRYFFYIKGM